MVESTQPTYDVSFEMKKHFNPSEITGIEYVINILELQHAFKLYDLDKNGTMNATEFTIRTAISKSHGASSSR